MRVGTVAARHSGVMPGGTRGQLVDLLLSEASQGAVHHMASNPAPAASDTDRTWLDDTAV